MELLRRRVLRAVLIFSIVLAHEASAAEIIPPKPPGYFNDYAGVVSKDAALRFNEQLAQFERETSNQVVVAVYRKMQSDSDIADYAQRVFQAWEIGNREKRNGVLFLVFIDDRKMRIHSGYGAEGALPDLTAFDIAERRVKPQFRTGAYEAGLATGIDSIMKALRGEYTGTGKTELESKSNAQKPGGLSCLAFLIFLFVLMMIARSSRRARRGWGYSGMGGPFIGGWGGGGGGWSGGSSSGGGFSGFSGGGGSSGGGGASSSW